MKKILFALFVVVVVGSCYWIGLETGFHKGKVEGFTEGDWSQWFSWSVLTTKTLKNRVVYFTEEPKSGHVRWHTVSKEGILWMADDIKKNDPPVQIFADAFMSGVTNMNLHRVVRKEVPK